MRIINFHEHPSERVAAYNRGHGVAGSVLLPVGEEAHGLALQMARAQPAMYIPFAWLGDLRDVGAAVARLEEGVLGEGRKGVKFQPLLQHFLPDERRLWPIYERAAALDVPLVFHTGYVGFRAEFGVPHIGRFGNTIFGLDVVTAEFPDLKVVVAHLGGNYDYEALVLAEKRPNVYTDTAYQHWFCRRLLPAVTPLERLKRWVAVLGPDRVLYGGEGFHPEEVLTSDLSEAERAAILGENAARLLRLPG
jgi:predicted TIM-barrel fold metal-dependent hydrolase